MTDTEKWLCEKCEAIYELKKIEGQLESAQAKYDGVYDGLYPKGFVTLHKAKKDKSSPVETAVILREQISEKIIENIKDRKLLYESKITKINDTIKKAGLTTREDKYINMRYFEDRPVSYIVTHFNSIGYICERTLNEIRTSALEKIEAVKE